MKNNITCCIITKNEEKVIGRCIDSCSKLTNKFIIVDTHSIDKTIEIAESKGAQVFSMKWQDDFSKAKNECLKYVKTKWWIWFDADEIITEEVAKKIKERIETVPDEVDVIILPWYYHFDLNNKPDLILKRERIIRTSSKLKWKYPIHEIVDYNNHKTIYWVDCPIEHRRIEYKVGRNLKIFERIMRQSKYQKDPRMLYYYATELSDNGKTDEAIRQFENYFKIAWWDEEKLRAMWKLAECYWTINSKQKARDIAIESLKISEQYAEPYFYLGNYEFSQKHYDRTLHWFKIAKDIKIPICNLAYYLPFYTYRVREMLAFTFNKLGRVYEAMSESIGALSYKNYDDKNLLYNLSLYRKFLKGKEKFKLGWLVQPDWNMGSHRIRRLIVNCEMHHKQGKIESKILWDNGFDYAKGLTCNAVIFTSFGKTELEWMERYEQAGVDIYFDHNELLFPPEKFPFMRECMEKSNYVVCCSEELARKSLELISSKLNVSIIEDGFM